MDKYEMLLDKISSELPVIEDDLEHKAGYTGLYRNDRIYIDRRRSSNEKYVVLAEEYAHHKLTVGNIINYRNPSSWKEECKARRYAIGKIVSLDDLLDCALNGCNNKYECADYLSVTPDIIEEALSYYYQKYGTTHFHRKYKFFFDNEFVSIDLIRNPAI